MKTSIIYLAQGNYWASRHSFESTGFAIKEKEVEFVIKDAPKEYIKTVGETEVELFVIDATGDKRTKEYFDKIFIIFQRLHAKNKFPGTGIGLALCKSLIEKHNGKIMFENIPSGGAMFAFSLPVIRKK